MLYLKTDIGRTEVQARVHALTPSQRQVLILCDGERDHEDLQAMVPPATLAPALQALCAMGLLEARDAPPRARPAAAAPMSEADRYRAIVELATSMAVDLGFTARIKAQLQIEKARTVADLTGVVDLLCKDLAGKHKDTPLLALRLGKLRQLAAEPA